MTLAVLRPAFIYMYVLSLKFYVFHSFRSFEPFIAWPATFQPTRFLRSPITFVESSLNSIPIYTVNVTAFQLTSKPYYKSRHKESEVSCYTCSIFGVMRDCSSFSTLCVVYVLLYADQATTATSTTFTSAATASSTADTTTNMNPLSTHAGFMQLSDITRRIL